MKHENSPFPKMSSYFRGVYGAKRLNLALGIFRSATALCLLVFTLLFVSVESASGSGGPPSAEVQEHLKKAQDYFKQEDNDGAIEELQKVLAERPDMAQVHNLLGLAYAKKEGFAQSAAQEFEEAASLEPRNAEPYFNLGTLYAGALKEPEDALDYFEKCIRTDPHYARAYFAMAWLYLFEKKDIPKALELFDKSASLLPNLAETYYGMAICYLQLNKRELTLSPISKLRELHREDLAMNIEKIMQPPPASAGGPQEGGGAQPQKPTLDPKTKKRPPSKK